ncbi:hypothetical protein FM112_16515 [Gulosibacter sp. 10]|nr:hypothetical protein FM112_16515 [Gulosibacter sp. 10]
MQEIYGLAQAGPGMFVMFMAMPLIAGALVARKNVLTVSLALMVSGAGLGAAGAMSYGCSPRRWCCSGPGRHARRSGR